MERWFPSAIVWYCDFTNVDNQAIINLAEEMRQKDLGRVISNIGGWQSNSIYIEDLPECMKPLHSNVEETLNKICAQFTYSKSVAVTEYWINVNKKGDRNMMHNHSNCTIAGVYYVKADNKSGAFKLHRDQHESFLWGSLTDNNNNPDTSGVVNYKPIPSRALFFPAWVNHSVDVSTSDEDRISIAFNAV
jgi:uncharacterized protein (TIGR02466 family)